MEVAEGFADFVWYQVRYKISFLAKFTCSCLELRFNAVTVFQLTALQFNKKEQVTYLVERFVQIISHTSMHADGVHDLFLSLSLINTSDKQPRVRIVYIHLQNSTSHHRLTIQL